jgi:hypothetical protein
MSGERLDESKISSRELALRVAHESLRKTTRERASFDSNFFVRGGFRSLGKVRVAFCRADAPQSGSCGV